MTLYEEDRPQTLVHPPFVMLTAFVAGFAMRAYFGGFLPLPKLLCEAIGTILILAAIVIMHMGVKTFAAGGERLRPPTPSRQLFITGIYKYSRNPIYVAMMMLGSGLGFATQNLWTILATIVAGIAIHFLVILPEEIYLEERFGGDYDAYVKSVRRWV